jgi:hypothetical protein
MVAWVRKWLVHALALLPTWSSLRLLGQSRLLAFTAIVPLLGSLLLFNEHVIDILLLSPSLVGRWLDVPDPTEASRTLTFHRLYFVYFGLSFLGIGSFGFALLCPNEIKRLPRVRTHKAGAGLRGVIHGSAGRSRWIDSG